MALNARSKGRRGEKMAVTFMKEWTGMDFKRTPGSGGLRGHVADYTEGDIVCVKKNYIFPLCLEVKFYEDLNFNHLLYDVNSKIKDFWKQTRSSAKRAEKIPILLMRYNRLPKNFFFVVIQARFGYLLNEAKFVPQFVYNRQLLITTTEEIKKLPWVKVDKIAKKSLGI
jgi:hypothetical protein